MPRAASKLSELTLSEVKSRLSLKVGLFVVVVVVVVTDAALPPETSQSQTCGDDVRCQSDVTTATTTNND